MFMYTCDSCLEVLHGRHVNSHQKVLPNPFMFSVLLLNNKLINLQLTV